MTQDIILAILSAIIPCVVANIVAIIVVLLNNSNSIKKLKMEQAENRRQSNQAQEKAKSEIIESNGKTIMIIETKLDALTKQVEQLSSLIERVYNLEASIKLVQAECARQSDRLDVIEDNVNELLKGVKL